MMEENKIQEEETTQKNTENQQEESVVNETETETISDENSNEEVKEPTADEKYAELNDKFVRLYSEFDNYRKRTNKEKLDLIANANAGILKDLVSVLDDFERAISNNENATDIDSVKEGFHLIYNKFKNQLESKGLKPMIAKGEAFDSELHEAIANIPAPTEDLKGKIIDDVEKGYYLNEKVIRYAKVVVGQ
jgi:molecular chaperone GrpE